MNQFMVGVRETLRSIRADRATMSTLVGAVVLYSFFYPAPYRSQTASSLPVAVVDLDKSSISRGLIRKTLAIRSIRAVTTSNSEAATRASVEHGEVQAFMVIPANFEHDVLRGARGHVALFGNGALLAHGGAALTGLGDALAAMGQEAAVAQARFAGAAAPPTLTLVRRPLFNTREGYGSVVVPAVAVLIVQQTLLLGIGLVFGARQQVGGKFSLPAVRLLGVMTAFCMSGIMALLYFAGFVFWFQDYPRAGNVGGLALAGTLFVASVVALGMLLGSFFRTREGVFQFIPLLSLPMFFLANVSWPSPSSPTALTWLAKLLPSTPGITVMVKLNQIGAQLSEASPELWNLAVILALYAALTFLRYSSLSRRSRIAVAR